MTTLAEHGPGGAAPQDWDQWVDREVWVDERDNVALRDGAAVHVLTASGRHEVHLDGAEWFTTGTGPFHGPTAEQAEGVAAHRHLYLATGAQPPETFDQWRQKAVWMALSDMLVRRDGAHLEILVAGPTTEDSDGAPWWARAEGEETFASLAPFVVPEGAWMERVVHADTGGPVPHEPGYGAHATTGSGTVIRHDPATTCWVTDDGHGAQWVEWAYHDGPLTPHLDGGR